MKVQNLSDDIEAKSEAFYPDAIYVGGAVEALKQVRKGLSRNAFAFVLYANFDSCRSLVLQDLPH
jgi:hypothetical protein